MARGASSATRITNQSRGRERLVGNARMPTLALATMRTTMAILESGSEEPMAVLLFPLMWSWMQEAIADLAGFVETRLIYMAPCQGRRHMQLLLNTTHTVLLMGCQVLLLLTQAMLQLLDTLVMVGHRQLCKVKALHRFR